MSAVVESPSGASPVATSLSTIRPRERDAVLQALRAGVVPRLGVRHIQVGRMGEVAQVLRDLERIADGGSAVRVVVGDYGSGKTFFLALARAAAQQAGLVTMHADLTPDRRLHSTTGAARALCAELIRSMSTRTKPDGGALAAVVERFLDAGTPEALEGRLALLRETANGHLLTHVLVRYAEAADASDEAGKAAALRWLRAEYDTRTEARIDLGVRGIVEDAGVHDHLKGMALLCRLAGYKGVLAVMDECVNLLRLVNPQARAANHEQILRMLNDALQGTAEGVGFYFAGTPEFLTDGRRGLWSYEALRSRLSENPHARGGLVDLSGPVLRLLPLTPEELYVLLSRLRGLFPEGETRMPDEGVEAVLARFAERLGAEAFRTPRNVVKAFLDVMCVLEQNATEDWRSLLGSVEPRADAPLPPDMRDDRDDGDATDEGFTPDPLPVRVIPKPVVPVRLAAPPARDDGKNARDAGADDLALFRI